MQEARERLIVALDLADAEQAVDLVRRLKDRVRYFKVGSELHNALGPRILELIYSEGGRVFLDLKFHDLPSVVSKAATVVTGLGVAMFSVHAAGGRAMLQAAAAAARQCAAELAITPPKVLGLTVLTSIDDTVLQQEMGVGRSLEEMVAFWSNMARQAGLDGAVASPREVAAVRRACGSDFMIVTPGIRPSWSQQDEDDQKRVLTPAEALAAGADYLVVGRPIIHAADPVAAAARVLDEMQGALAGRPSAKEEG